MKVAKKLVELFSHHKALNKYIKSIEHDFSHRTCFVFLACAIKESECDFDLPYYRIPDVLDICHQMDFVKNMSNQYPFYREHKLLLESGYIERLTTKEPYKGQRFNISIQGRIELRRIYNYLIRELYSSL